MLPTLVLRAALEMLWRGFAFPPFHSFSSFPVPFMVLFLFLFLSFPSPFPFLSVPVLSVPFLPCPFFCFLFLFFSFLSFLFLSCPFLSLSVSFFFPCWAVLPKSGHLLEPPATPFVPFPLPTSLSAGGWSYR